MSIVRLSTLCALVLFASATSTPRMAPRVLSTVTTTPQHNQRLTVETLENGHSRHRLATSRSVGSGSGGPTNPPVEQPHSMLFYFTVWCNQSLQLVPGTAQMFNGGWKVAPPAWAWAQNTGSVVEGFQAEGFPGNDYINGTATYGTTPSGGFDSIQMGFAAVIGEWIVETVSPTAWGLEIMSGDFGSIAFYNIVTGFPHTQPSTC